MSGLPFEATTRFMAEMEAERMQAVQVFLNKLTPQEQERFHEFMHHFVHVGFEAGLSRRLSGDTISDEQRAQVLGHQARLYLLGVEDGKIFEAEQRGDEE